MRLTFNTAGGDGAPVTEEFSVDAIEGGRTRRKSKKEILIAKDVDIEKVELLHMLNEPCRVLI
jgi:hypothetical protein